MAHPVQSPPVMQLPAVPSRAMSPFTVSREVVARIHSDQLRIVVLLEEVQRMTGDHPRLAQLTLALGDTIREHLSLVEGVLEAVTSDEVDPRA